MSECVFCKIAKGEAPASVVFSDEKTIAFLDTQPVNPGHVLVIPRAHIAELSRLESETGGQLFEAAMIAAAGLRKSGLRCEGINLFLADGEAAFQEVFHVHLHVIPRFRGDGFGLTFGSHYGRKPERRELDIIADQVRRAISM
jgi:histidine triad (HIT) family protein